MTKIHKYSFLVLIIFVDKAICDFIRGNHEKCEVEAYRYEDQLPAVRLVTKLNMTLDYSDFGNNPYSFIVARYDKGVAKLEITFDKENQIMTIKKRYPPRELDITVLGYAVPVNKNNEKGNCVTVGFRPPPKVKSL